MNFPSFDIDEVQTCTTLAYDESEGEFTQHQLDIQIGNCFDSPCPLNIDPNLIQNGRILNGTSVVCEPSGQIGIITKSKLYLNFLNNNQFQGSNNEEIELIMLSKTRFDNLELLQKADKVNATNQDYEDVDGFESLRKICTVIRESQNEKTWSYLVSMGLQTRTTTFSCGGNNEDYDENLLMSRPLPWVVRVYFKSESSMKGTLCSGNTIFTQSPPA